MVAVQLCFPEHKPGADACQRLSASGAVIFRSRTAEPGHFRREVESRGVIETLVPDGKSGDRGEEATLCRFEYRSDAESKRTALKR